MSTRRLTSALTLAGFLAAAIVLLLSDRAGSLLGDFVAVVTRAGRSVERNSGLDLLDRSDIPGEADQIVHAAFWGSGMLLIGWMSRRRIPIAIMGLLVGGTSLAFELAQPLLSRTRAVEASDAGANLIGVVAASVVLIVVMAVRRRLLGEDRLYRAGRQPTGHDVTDEMFLSL